MLCLGLLVKGCDRHHDLRAGFCLVSKQHSWRQCKIRRWKPLVEHQINEDAGNGNVKPDWHGPFSDATMSVPTPAEDGNERENDEWKGHKCEQDVADQHCEINGCNGAAGAETGRAFTGIIMVDEITGEKGAR